MESREDIKGYYSNPASAGKRGKGGSAVSYGAANINGGANAQMHSSPVKQPTRSPSVSDEIDSYYSNPVASAGKKGKDGSAVAYEASSITGGATAQAYPLPVMHPPRSSNVVDKIDSYYSNPASAGKKGASAVAYESSNINGGAQAQAYLSPPVMHPPRSPHVVDKIDSYYSNPASAGKKGGSVGSAVAYESSNITGGTKAQMHSPPVKQQTRSPIVSDEMKIDSYYSNPAIAGKKGNGGSAVAYESSNINGGAQTHAYFSPPVVQPPLSPNVGDEMSYHSNPAIAGNEGVSVGAKAEGKSQVVSSSPVMQSPLISNVSDEIESYYSNSKPANEGNEGKKGASASAATYELIYINGEEKMIEHDVTFEYDHIFDFD